MRRNTKETRNKKVEKLLSFAKQFVGTPYKYGATMKDAPRYFDCSGFVKYVFEHFGYEMPRSTIEQAQFSGRRVAGIKNIKVGDLIFLHGERGHYNKKFPQGIGHVVLYIGGGEVIHASSRRTKNYPHIVENGSVRRDSLEKTISKSGPIIAIKRVL